ncbi:MAG: hypothetical protein RLZZ502_1927 [Pseudomonadota bacterium]|jgi:tripartite-type tricarboxylate transporter receptor subunit TctC
MRRLLLLGLAVFSSVLSAQPIKIIVPFAAGAGSDAMARFIGNELHKISGRPVVVENKTGAGGAIGADFVAKSPADGTTLLFIASPFTTAAAAGVAPKYEPSEFAPVAIMGYGPLLFAANPKLPGKDLREVIAFAKANPGKVNYGSAGNGSINHLVVELLKQASGSELTHVPYKGIADATRDLVGGQIELITGSVPALMPLIREGKLKALALTSKKRSAVIEGIAAMDELGFKGFDVNNYWGLMAPPKTPEAMTTQLNQWVNTIVQQPEVITRLKQDATEPTRMSTAEVKEFISQDMLRWRKLIETAALKLD